MTVRARIAGLSVIGPGIGCWSELRSILRGEKDWTPKPTVINPDGILQGNKRRRASPAVQLALQAANEACEDAQIEPTTTSTVFSSAFGDGYVLDGILRSLSASERYVSPTMFHNSVHNAAVGYWNIAISSHLPSTSVAGGDYSFGCGLLKALAEVNVEGGPVVLVQFDCPLREPLDGNRPIGFAFAVGFVLVSCDDHEGAIIEARLDAMWEPDTDTRASPPARVRPEELSGLVMPENVNAPAVWALPLLHLLARRREASVDIPVAEGVSLKTTLIR